MRRNKNDVKEDEKVVSYADGERFAKENGLLFMETSAKTGLQCGQDLRGHGERDHPKNQVGSDDLGREGRSEGGGGLGFHDHKDQQCADGRREEEELLLDSS